MRGQIAVSIAVTSPGFRDAERMSEPARLPTQTARATARRRAAEARLKAVRSSAAGRLGRALARPLDSARGVVGRNRRS